MSRSIKVILGVLLFINLAILGLFSMPVAWTLGALDYGHSASYIYTPLDHVSASTKKIFWQIAGDDFFKPGDIALGNILPVVWEDPFKRKSQKPFHQAQSQIFSYILSNASQDNAWQKLHATILAIKLHKFFKPERIFELYLNTIPIGQNVYGVGQASAQYFQKTADQLTPEETAFFIALSQFGSHYDPWRDAGRVQQLQQEILFKIK